MKAYTYKIRGTAADGQTWETEGYVDSAESTGMSMLVDLAMRSTFDQLTHGRAVFGQPGKGCAGPYRITHLQFDLVEPS